MKKIIGLFIGLCLVSNVFAASSGFGDLTKNLKALDGTKVETLTGEIPEGRELFPILYQYVHLKPDLTGTKTVALKCELTKADVINNDYEYNYKIYYKAGFGIQCQEADITVTSENNNFTLGTKKFVSYNCDSNLKRTGDVMEMAKKSMNANTKSHFDAIKSNLSSISDEEYQSCSEKAYSDFQIQLDVSKYAANRLKAKKWYEKHPLEGKEVEIPFMFTSIKESKVEGYEYELSGMVGIIDAVLIYVLSNNDDYVDTKDETVIIAKGIVKSVTYSNEYDVDYKIKYIVIEER